MKTKHYFILAGLSLLTMRLQAQAPNLLNYQGVARNFVGAVLQNQPIGLRFTIHQGAANGSVVYQETQKDTTNVFGLFTTAIGAGTVVQGSFSAIAWSASSAYLQVELDTTGSAGYTDMGTTQFLSVPYALSAGSLSTVGTAAYLPRWSTSTTFDTSNIQNDGYTVGIGAPPFSNDMLLVQNSSGNLYGIVGYTSDNNAGTGIVGGNTSTSPAGVGNGVWGFTVQTGGYGVAGQNYEGTGVGVGVYGGGSGATGAVMQFGEGVYGEGTTAGVFGYADDTAAGTKTWPGYFQSGDGGYAGVAEQFNGTDYKIVGSGTVSTVVKDNNNADRIMNCPEAPEILFEDYGAAALYNGRAHINLDAIYAKNVTITANHPLRVLITLEGDCNGVYVTNKTAAGFDVVELKSGTSNVPFTYEVIANRADSYDANGKLLSKNADNRFVIGTGLRPAAKTVAAAALRKAVPPPIPALPKNTVN